MRNYRIVLAAALVVWPFAGCTDASVESAPPMPTTTTAPVVPAGTAIDAAAYLAPMTLKEWLAVTPTVLVGTVTEIGGPERHSETIPDGQRFDMVYSPVTVAVDIVVAGDYRPDQVLTVRFLGGTADDVDFHFEGAPDVKQVEKGSRILVMADDVSGSTTMTPTIVLSEKDGAFTELGKVATDGEQPIELAQVTGTAD